MAEPTVVDCAAACTVTVVHELSLPPLQIPVEDAAQIAGAVMVVWAAGWVIRMLIRTVNSGDSKVDTE